MNDHDFPPRRVIAGSAVIGGVLVTVIPRHAVSILQIVIATVAVVAGLFALAVTVPPTGWLWPFKWMSPFGRGATGGRRDDGPDGFGSIRRKLSGWRLPIGSCPPMPVGVANMLRPLIRSSLRLGPAEEPQPATLPAGISALTWSILTSDAPRKRDWFRALPPHPREVARLVDHVLDDLDSIDPHPGNDPEATEASNHE
jgi:hypothetical protein